MESIEKTPTPRENLSLIKKSIETLLTDEIELLTILNEGYERDEKDLEKAKNKINQDFTQNIFDEDSEVQTVNHLELFKSKLENMVSSITTCLETNDFSSLADFSKEAHSTFNQELLNQNRDELDVDLNGDITVLNTIYKEYLDKIDTLVSQLAEQPEFDLS